MSEIKQMVSRFLAWKLPSDFHPDAGITFKAAFNEHTEHPMTHEPTGTNLFTATQAEAMIRHLVGQPSPMKMAVDQDWLNAKVADDPDAECDVSVMHSEAQEGEAAHARNLSPRLPDRKYLDAAAVEVGYGDWFKVPCVFMTNENIAIITRAWELNVAALATPATSA